MHFYITSILLVSTRMQLVASTATLTLPTSANCGDPAVLTCTSSGCTSGYRFARNNVTIYNKAGPAPTISDPDRYSATDTSDTQIQLTITNIQYSDAVEYTCTCGFNLLSTGQTLVYQCKASTSSASVTSDKKLSITVDRLYPEPSSIVTTNTTDTLQGAQMCRPSSTLPSHFRCSWDSTTSFPDGIHRYTITVTTVTQAAPVSGLFRIVTPTSPNISNLVTISNNHQVLHGVQDTPLTIQCVSRGGIPAPTLAWYRGNTSTSPLAQSSISDSLQMPDGTYTVYLTYDFTPSRTDDLTPLLCRVFYPGATSGASPDPSPAAAILYLDLKPSSPTVSHTSEAVSGGSMALRCTSVNGRPAPNITWSYRGQTFSPTNTLSLDQTSETYTVVSVLQRPVSAEDNGQTATCEVSHTTYSLPRTGTITVDIKFGPSAGSTTIYGNQATLATGITQIRLNCTSDSSYPASNITWYNGSDVIPNTAGYTRWPGNNNGVITSNILTITPTRYMDGDRITCRPDNSYGFDSTHVDLDILYSSLIQPLLNITSTEGEPDVSLTCSASSKPPSNFTWFKGDMALASGTGTLTENSFSYAIPRVDRADAGSYQCKADNDVGNLDLKNMDLVVKYPPAVTVSTTFSPSHTVTCKAEGYPDSYMYQDWVQIWPGYGPVATIRFTGTTLNLTGATYERSGVYVCCASNGVAVYGTDMKFMKGNATVVIKAPPVLTDPSSDGTIVPVAGRHGKDATTEIKYWSNVDGSVVKCYKHVGGSRSSLSNCSVMETKTEVTLPVHNHMVTETGTLAIIKIHISSQEDMTAYDVVVSNSVQGESVLGIIILPQGPPEAPTILGNFSITPGQVILTVLPGFHGGYNQTLVVQISTDLTTWINITSVHIGLDNRPTDAILASLMENTLHYIRVFAYNTEGGSNNFSTVMNFTTDFTTAKDVSASPPSAALMWAFIGTTCALMVVAVLVVVVLRSKKVGLGCFKRIDTSSNIYESTAAANDSAHVYSQLHKPVDISGVQHRSNDINLYERPNALTSPEHVYSVLSVPAKEDMYVNLRV